MNATTAPLAARRARLALAAATVLVGAGVALAPAASAATGPSSGPFTPEQNSPDAWCDNGYKVEMGGEQFTFELTEPAAILVLKAATTNYWWTDAEAGTYTVPGKNAISHVIVCPADAPSDEPSQPTDEPSHPTDDPTPTDEQTEPADEPSEPSQTPSEETTTPAPEVVTEVSSSATPLEVSELAHTGGGGSTPPALLAGAGLAFVALGATALRAGRRGEHA